MNQKGGSILGFLLGFALFVGFIYVIFNGWHYDIGRGQHTGVVTAVERNGIIWKTARAYVKTDSQSSQEDTYCVTDTEVEKDLKAAAESKANVTLHYVSWLISGITNCNAESAVIYEVSANE